MDTGVFDPALFTSQSQDESPQSATTRETDSLADRINELPRFPNQIGGVTIASLHSRNPSYGPHFFLNPIQNRERNPFVTSQAHGSDRVTNDNSLDPQNHYVPQAFITRQQERALQPEFVAGYSYVPASLVPQGPQYDRSKGTRSRPGGLRRKPRLADSFPKFHCGEAGCDFYRTDGNSLGGRYAMAKHYKKDHPDLHFNYKRLVSSHIGERSQRMLSKGEHKKMESAEISSMINQMGYMAPQHAAPQYAPPQHIPIDPALILASAPDAEQYIQFNNIRVNAEGQQVQSMQPQLPPLHQGCFTNVPDLHLTNKEFVARTAELRTACDAEMFKVRSLLLSYCRTLGRSDEDFSALRKKTSYECIRHVYNFVTKAVGPLNDNFRENFGMKGDTVLELAEIIYAGLNRSYVPANGIWVDGTALSMDEIRRRDFCCRVHGMQLCLLACQKQVRQCDQMLDSARKKASEKHYSQTAV